MNSSDYIIATSIWSHYINNKLGYKTFSHLIGFFERDLDDIGNIFTISQCKRIGKNIENTIKIYDKR